ncbi:MAG TPA: hypothetical protein VK188_16785 [Holophaga sp.]|nr:hypothetical protein [Holophaga sp.]
MTSGFTKWFALGMALLLPGTLKADDKRIWVNNSKSALSLQLVPRPGKPEKGNLWFSRVVGQQPDPKDASKKVPIWSEYGVLGETTASDPNKVVLWGPGERISVEFTHTGGVFNHSIRIAPMEGEFSSLDVTLDQPWHSKTIEFKTTAASLPKDAKGNLIYLLNTPDKGNLTINDPGVKFDQRKEKAEFDDATKARIPPDADWKNIGLTPGAKPTKDEFKKLLNTLRVKYHPDKVPNSATDPEVMEKATEKWNALMLSYNKVAAYLGFPGVR